MGNVRILTDRVANQIAAGEVIERPAAVVKELVENSIDAGATRVEVEFRQGGRSLIRVEDNGQGMSRDDALLSLERHATSKIWEAADLDRLASYGFRGEALPSIASVSRFELQTRTAESESGTEILVNGGKFVHVRDCGRAVGTCIEVTQLFNSVPARRKFLKTDATESAHIVQCVRLYALACPKVAFSLHEEGRLIFRSPECATLPERIAEIFGRQTAEALLPIDVAEPGLRLSGLIGRPGVGRATRHEMIVFVNQRPVDSRTLNYGLIESYHESLPKGRYPLAFVFFECDPASVDVNVHPAKREVRFRSEPLVRSFVIRSVLQRLRDLHAGTGPEQRANFTGTSPVLQTSATAPTYGRGEISPGSGEATKPIPGLSSATFHSGPGSGTVLRANWKNPAFSPVHSLGAGSLSNPATPAIASSDSAVAASPNSGHAWRFVGIAHGNYGLFETAAGLVLLDRRAAHERVWYERLREQFRGGVVPSQRLLLPVPVELDPVATALLLERLAFLNAHGFEISEFGRNFFRIEALPAWMEPADAEPLLRDLLAEFREGRWQGKTVEIAREELARLAATKAVRLPEQAPEAELQALVTQLFATRNPLTSPGGRPTHIELNHSELARRFQK